MKPGRITEAIAVGVMSPLRKLFLEWVMALRHLRDTASIRSKLLTLIFSITPADRAAVLIDNILLSRERDGAAPAVAVDREVMDRVLKDGSPILTHERGRPRLCIPLDAFDSRVGVIYAEASDSGEPLDNTHLHLLTGVAAVAALAFEHASFIEQLQAQNSRLK
ncbi:MAG: GAF domain-containing protein, partial [Acidobacteria bacterium]|nr:GAF domain-containing protein [Acidobacteriota bacterium]